MYHNLFDPSVQVYSKESVCRLQSLHGWSTSIHVLMSTSVWNETCVMMVVTFSWMKNDTAFKREKKEGTKKVISSINVSMVGNCHRSSLYLVLHLSSSARDCRRRRRKSSALQQPVHPLPVIWRKSFTHKVSMSRRFNSLFCLSWRC